MDDNKMNDIKQKNDDFLHQKRSEEEKRNDYGRLITPQIKFHRKWFNEMCRMRGVRAMYQAPLSDKEFDLNAELKSNYQPKEPVWCIFDQYPDQKTMKKVGWVAELQENSSIIHVPYDLHDLQVGALFWIPTGLDDGEPRLFRVISMYTKMIYPASVACEIAPEYESTDEPVLVSDYESSTDNLLLDLEGDD